MINGEVHLESKIEEIHIRRWIKIGRNRNKT